MGEVNCGFQDTPTTSGKILLAALGPTILVDIGFDPTYTTKSKTTPNLGIKGVVALVDTGATECCIDNLLAVQLNLPLVDKRQIAGSSGAHTANVYLAQIYVASLNFTITGKFAGVDLAAGGQVHKALMGRTFLANLRMIYEGKTGIVKISHS